MPRYKLTIAYDGANFHGFQAQRPPDRPPLRTVQDTLRDAAIQATKQPLEITGASRTDSGVHALGQVAHVDLDTRIPDDRIALAINARLPVDVEIVACEPVPDTFHAISDVISKQYRYIIWNTRRRPLHRRKYVAHCRHALDVDLMRQAASRIVGTHDFEGFSTAGHGRETTVRTIHGCEIEEKSDRPELHMTVRGDGFLYNMVRIIAGTLVEIGRGRMPVDRIDHILATADRQLAGPTMPAEGLWLEWIKYAPQTDELGN